MVGASMTIFLLALAEQLKANTQRYGMVVEHSLELFLHPCRLLCPELHHHYL